MFNLKFWVEEKSPEFLKSKGEELLLEAGFQILGFNDHHFTPHGYTALWLLAESHLALHTFPENNKAYFELTSCSKSKQLIFEKKALEIFKISV